MATREYTEEMRQDQAEAPISSDAGQQSEDEEEDDQGDEEDARLLLQSWQWHLPALDLILSPSLSLHLAIAAVSAMVERVKSLDPRKDHQLTGQAVNRFFDEEYLARMDAQQARDRARWHRCRHLGIVLSITLFVLVTFGLVMLLVYCDLNPTFPRLDIVTATISYLKMQDVDAASILAQQAEGKGVYFAATYNFSIVFTLDFRNPNRKVDLFVQSLDLTSYYYGFKLGRGSLAAFKQPRHSSSLINVQLLEPDLPVPLKENYSIKKDLATQFISFLIEIRLKARMSTVSNLKSPLFWCSVKCDVTIDDWGIIHRKKCSNM